MAVPVVVDLLGRDRLVLGRRDPEVAAGPALIACDDRWMSRAHTAIERGLSGWTIADQGSANGTLLNGQRVSLGSLVDGDVIETGSTFWVFRDAIVDDEPSTTAADGPFLSVAPNFQAAVALAERLAPSEVPVMIIGPTGTGKELLARHIHALSGRPGPFVAINTAAVQSSLVASELFGVERGAHSMAEHSRTGQIRSASDGTLLLDEIGDMPLEVQASLLRVLQENEGLPVGGDRPAPVDVRFLCATHQSIPELVAAGRFRSDLLGRLQGATIQIPALAERREDIGLLVGRFLRTYDAATFTLTPGAYRALMTYDWPRNVRELQRVVQAAVAVAESGRIELAHLPPEVQHARKPNSRPELEETDRRRELIRLLTAHRGNVSAVARSMGYSRMQVHRWLKQYGINPDHYRPADD